MKTVAFRACRLLPGLCLCLTTLLAAQARQAPPADPSRYAPDPSAIAHTTTSELRDIVDRFDTDRDALNRRFAPTTSPAARAAQRAFAAGWSARLSAMNFDSLSRDAKADWILLSAEIAHDQSELAREERQLAAIAPMAGFADTIYALENARRRLETIRPSDVAATLNRLTATIVATQRSVADRMRDTSARNTSRPSKIDAYRSAELLAGVRQMFARWFRYYDGYDPMFTWWARAPYQRADSALGGYLTYLRERIVGYRPGEDEPIVGMPIGRDALMDDLRHEMIPYTPEQLIAIARREMAWCDSEMLKASREMGFGDDWHAALEKVKNDFVEPGRQTDLVRDLAIEAEDYVEQHDLVTVPPLARDLWRMEMMTPERQKVNPFFTGGEVISVSYPTDGMSEDDKMMSMRGNNIHFARATVFHELIPGHHLQGFMSQRYNAHRRVFATPFWNEGNSFYWEMLLWDMNFQRSPEDRVGMLFWRMHRAARIIFSLSFHLGTMTPQQAIDFLVERVGHERANAVGEVRRSFNGSYSPLYQVAYMIGGLQFRALHHELVDSGRMTNRDFHDAMLKGGTMPVEMVRNLLTGEPLPRDYRAHWMFAGDNPR